MSRSKSALSITQRLLIDYIKFKTNHNFKFFAKNDKISFFFSSLKILSHCSKNVLEIKLLIFDKNASACLFCSSVPFKRFVI